MGAHPSIFISHSRADRELADQIAKSLDDAGLAVKWPETELHGGDRWAEAVKAALTDSDVMVIIVPAEGAAGSNNAFFELGIAGALNKPIVAVVTDSSNRSDIKAAPVVPADDLSGLLGKVEAALKKIPVGGRPL
jgi:nucleoside 2-deoxyribosyltransferase